jgi:RES domain-containing protein
MKLYRIGDGRHPIWDGTGAAFVGGRWNSVGRQVIYASPSYSCAMLEILAHASIGRIPKHQRYVCVDVPSNISIEKLDANALPQGWDAPDSVVARDFGDRWLAEARSVVLVIPSVVAKLDFIAVVNPAHPDAQRLQPSAPENVVWDERLFR